MPGFAQQMPIYSHQESSPHFPNEKKCRRRRNAASGSIEHIDWVIYREASLISLDEEMVMSLVWKTHDYDDWPASLLTRPIRRCQCRRAHWVKVKYTIPRETMITLGLYSRIYRFVAAWPKPHKNKKQSRLKLLLIKLHLFHFRIYLYYFSDTSLHFTSFLYR